VRIGLAPGPLSPPAIAQWIGDFAIEPLRRGHDDVGPSEEVFLDDPRFNLGLISTLVEKLLIAHIVPSDESQCDSLRGT